MCALTIIDLLFSTGTWSSPETTGPRPPPCAGFSFTKVDLSRVVLFGGEQEKGRFQSHLNELHILDMDSWVSRWIAHVEVILLPNIITTPQHWSGAILPSSPTDLWPRGRISHSACALFGSTSSSASGDSSKAVTFSPSSDTSTGQHNPQLFVLWGAGFMLHPINDAWILDICRAPAGALQISRLERVQIDFRGHCLNEKQMENIPLLNCTRTNLWLQVGGWG